MVDRIGELVDVLYQALDKPVPSTKPGSPRSQGQSAMDSMLDEMLEKYDIDSSGTISAEEFTRSAFFMSFSLALALSPAMCVCVVSAMY